MLDRIIIKEEVYIPVRELHKKEIYMGDIERIDPTVKPVSSKYGKLLKEEDLNSVLERSNELLERNGGYIEMTRLDSLEARIEHIKAFEPLKYMFLKGMHESEDAIERKLKKEHEEEVEKAISALRKEKDALGSYEEKKASYTKGGEFFDHERLKKEGLSVQFLTTIYGDVNIGLTAYVTGPGVFMCADDEQDWRTFIKEEDGSILLPDIYNEKPVRYKDFKLPRDFSNYTVRENICWCLLNLPVTNDWVDYYNCSYGTVDFDIETGIALHLLNPAACKGTVFIDGFI